jgi:D-hexose-6-phosphate mutarotase
MATDNFATESKSGAPGRVTFLDGQNELPMIEVSTPWSTAEIYLHGAHVTHFQKQGEAPLLFMSQCSRFEEERPIRGGVPIIFPWFGQREGLGQHGFARVTNWEFKEFSTAADGSVSVRFRLPECPEASAFPPFTADYLVTVNQSLAMCLTVTNNSKEDELAFENCLHTYFAVSDVTAISITGLKGMTYLDQVARFARKAETKEGIRISSEVDRIYLNTTGPVDILDPRLGRKVHVEKQGSASTVVWNPWTIKAQQMPDFGNDEYERMVCVESGNVAANSLKLRPGETSTLAVKLSSETVS